MCVHSLAAASAPRRQRPSTSLSKHAGGAAQLRVYSMDERLPTALMTRWRARAPAQRWLLGLGAAVVAVQAIVIAHRRLTHLGDFDVSREFGRRFLAGEPLYAGGLHYPYMPTAALYFAPLAWLPPGLGLALRYVLALGCLWLTLRLLHAMVRARRPALAAERLALATLTLLFASHYVLRDLDDGGPHLILLAMVVGGIFCVWRGRTGAGALWFGLAAALKAPNALFLPFFVWKRQWRLAVLSTAALVAFTLVPLAWMGPAPWWNQQREWLHMAIASARGQASGGARESEERVQNQAMRPVLARYIGASSPTTGGLGGDADVGAAARRDWIVPMLAVGAVLACCAWWTRRPFAEPDDDAWLRETSAVLILSVLLAPVAWLQHLVVAIPALYLIAATQRSAPGLGAPASAAMATYFVLAVLLNREVLGREWSLALLAYGTHALCMLIVLAVLARRCKW